MTECYVCGHPILEGQRQTAQTVINAARGEWQHLNPADHLPTLAKPSHQQVRDELLGVESPPDASESTGRR